MKLNKKTLSYFERKRKEKGNTCIIYIDAHGEESASCSEDPNSATVFSFAGVSGAVSYATQYDKPGKKIPSSLHYRDIISKVAPQEVKQRAIDMSRELKPHLKKIVDLQRDTSVKKWTRKHFGKYALVPMKQIIKKEYVFLDDSDEKHNYDFGIYMIDTSSTETKGLIGKNIISEDFLLEFQEEFPEAVTYLIELSSNDENEELMDAYKTLGPNCIGKITFEQLIHLLKLLGFDYTYIFDDSCRSRDSIDNKLLKLAEKERKVSLEKLPFKMKSTSMPKTRKRILSDLKKGDSFVKDIRRELHTKIKNNVYDIFDDFDKDKSLMELHLELHLMEDTNKKMIFHLFIKDEKVLVIEILFNFLKVKVEVKQIKRIAFLTPFIERIKAIHK